MQLQHHSKQGTSPVYSESRCTEPQLSPARKRHRSSGTIESTQVLSPLGCSFTPELKKAKGPVQQDIPVQSSMDEMPRVVHVTTGEEFWRAQLDAIYSRRNPIRRGQLTDLLEKYRGQEALLYRKVCERYDLCPTKFYADPRAWVGLDDDIMDEDTSPGDAPRYGQMKRLEEFGMPGKVAYLLTRMACSRRSEGSTGRRTTLLFGSKCENFEKVFTGPHAHKELFSPHETESTECVAPGSFLSGAAAHQLPGCSDLDRLSLVAHKQLEHGTAVDVGSSKDPPPPAAKDIGARKIFASAFDFRFVTGSAVFGPLANRPRYETVDPELSPHANANMDQVRLQAVEQRRASAAVLAQRRILHVSRTVQTTFESSAPRMAKASCTDDVEGLPLSSLGLDMNVRADLKRKAKQFESGGQNGARSPGISMRTKVLRSDNVPSPARIGFGRENINTHRRQALR
jgi:hypothetical protein